MDEMIKNKGSVPMRTVYHGDVEYTVFSEFGSQSLVELLAEYVADKIIHSDNSNKAA